MRHFSLSQNSVWGEWCDINKLGRGGNLMEDKEEQARPKKKNGAPKKPISPYMFFCAEERERGGAFQASQESKPESWEPVGELSLTKTSTSIWPKKTRRDTRLRKLPSMEKSKAMNRATRGRKQSPTSTMTSTVMRQREEESLLCPM